MSCGEALDVQLVDDGVGPGVQRPVVLAPGEDVVHDHRTRHERRAVLVLLLAVAAGRRTEYGVVQPQLAVDSSRVGVEQQLARVEPLAPRGVERAVDPVAVAGRRADLRDVAVPDVER